MKENVTPGRKHKKKDSKNHLKQCYKIKHAVQTIKSNVITKLLSSQSTCSKMS